MKSSLKSFLTPIAACLLLSACSSDNCDCDDMAAELTGAERFIGTWLLNCATGNGAQEYKTEIIVIGDGTFKLTFDTFSDSECTQSLGSDRRGTFVGSYTLGPEVDLPNAAMTSEVDIDFTDLGVIELDLAFREGNTLYLGVESASDERPTEINFTEPYGLVTF